MNAFVRSYWLILLILFSCNGPGEPAGSGSNGKARDASGSLFIIGGGALPDRLVSELIDVSGIREGGYGVILPMSGANPDSAVQRVDSLFRKQGVENVRGLQFIQPYDYSATRIDSVRNADLIYIPGGNQQRFMEAVNETALHSALKTAFRNGAVIGGNGAGAAVMCANMITGVENKHPDYNETFQHLQPNNIQLTNGLGLLENVIIDQHFITRSRYNRLISSVLEVPDALGIGIDEGAAIIVRGDTARITGRSQVVLIRNFGTTKIQGELLGSRDVRLEVLLPGDTFILDPGVD